jgi:hypothetical protein
MKKQSTKTPVNLEPVQEVITEQPTRNIAHRGTFITKGLITSIVLIYAFVAYAHNKNIIFGHSGNLLASIEAAKVASTSPDAVLLRINGVDIKRKSYTLSINNIVQIAEAQNLNINDPAIVEQIQNLALANVVNTQLLAQKARADGITATKDKVDESVRTIAESAGSPQKLAEGLQRIGMTSTELREAVANEILATTYLNVLLARSEAPVTENEIHDYFKEQQTNAASGTRATLTKELGAKIKEKLQAQKNEQIVQDFLTELRKQAKIEVIDQK